ncbi:MAG TPA: hypothetical protein VG798_02630 [Rhizomicrobium sp.]|nr:hypothetical protein [Rhizomicrobium sp.]
MRTLTTAGFLLSLGVSAFAADTSQAVLDRHVAAMKAGDLNAVMADYDDNAMVIAPHGIAPGEKSVSGNDVFAGKTSIRKFFEVLTDKAHNPGAKSMTVEYETRGSDVTVMHWVQFPGASNQISGNDTWIIRDGKVIAQIVAVDSAPARR